jgi:hypothetical protein
MIEIIIMLAIFLSALKPKGFVYIHKNGNTFLTPILRPGEFRFQARRRLNMVLKRKFKSLQGVRFILYDLMVLIEYPHYRYAKYLQAQGAYRHTIPWRIDMAKAKFKIWWNRTNKTGIAVTVMIALFTTIIGFPVIVGANHYFSPTGDDSYDASSPIWVSGTIGPKKTPAGHNAAVVGWGPGDVIYWEADGDFKQSVVGGAATFLYIQTSGELGSVITYTTYGVGDDAVLEWLYGNATYITINHIHVDNVDRNTQRCIVFSEGGVANDGITIINCEIEHGTTPITLKKYGGVGWTLNNLNMHDFSSLAIYCDSIATSHAQNLTFTNITIDSTNLPQPNNADGMSLHEGGSTTTDYIEGPCVIHTWVWIAPSFDEFTFDIVSGVNGKMYNCVIPDSHNGCLSYGHSAGKRSDDSNGRWDFFSCIFLSDEYYAITFDGQNAYAYNCLVVCSGTRGVVITDGGYAYNPAPGVNASFPVHNIHFVYCTFIDTGLSEYMFRIIYDSAAGGYTATGFFVQNSIIISYVQAISFGGTHIGDWALNDGSTNWDYNCWFDPGGAVAFGGFGLSTFASFQAGGMEAHGMEDDPELVDPTGSTGGWPDDAELLATSPCIGAALPITTGDYYYYDSDSEETDYSVDDTGIVHDYYGLSRSAYPCMGAFEFGGVATRSIRGTVLLSGLPVEGIVVSDGSRSDTTDENGDYTITGVPDPGNYNVIPVKTGFVFNPTYRAVAISGASASDVDFTALSHPTMTIADGNTYNMISGSELDMDWINQDGGVIRNLDDSPAVEPIMDGDIDNQTGGVCGHAGGTHNSVTVTGEKNGAGLYIGEFAGVGGGLSIEDFNISKIINRYEQVNLRKEVRIENIID